MELDGFREIRPLIINWIRADSKKSVQNRVNWIRADSEKSVQTSG